MDNKIQKACNDRIGGRVWGLIRQISKGHDVEILKGHVNKGHVRLLVSVPPHLAISKLVQ